MSEHVQERRSRRGKAVMQGANPRWKRRGGSSPLYYAPY